MTERRSKFGTTTTLVVAKIPDLPPGIHGALVGMAGSVFGHRFLLMQDVITIGRDPVACDLVVDDSGVSRVHAELHRTETSYRVVDKGSKNGTVVDDVAVTSADLADGQILTLGSASLKYLRANPLEIAYHERMAQLSATDPLTGLANRRQAHEALVREVARALRAASPLAIALVDLDHFKRINDTHGHTVGDACLVEFAGRARAAARAGDIVARVGGEEFLVILPDSDALDAAEFASRLLRDVSARGFETPVGRVAVTVSIGVADLEELQQVHGLPRAADSDVVDLFIAVADAKLYEAKQLGRNRIAI